MQTYDLQRKSLFGGVTRLQRLYPPSRGLSSLIKNSLQPRRLTKMKKPLWYMLEAPTMTIHHPSRVVQIASLNVTDAPVVIPTEYFDHISVFSSESTSELSNTPRAGADHSRWTRALHSSRGSVAFDQKVAQLPRSCQAIQTSRPHKYVPPGEDLQRQLMEDCAQPGMVTSSTKYSKEELQRILKTVLEV